MKEAFISIPMDIKKKGDILYAGDFKGDSLLYCL
ncbi:TolB-like 6-bladed beta-propeller domain-containing protein [Bacteroides thetaiotaomicron]|nr:TolB-like 6-bladed beta-propeller domain-containing protein [Bacteroides thetaiotaomicron]